MYLAIFLLAAVIVFSIFLNVKRRQSRSTISNRRRRTQKISPQFEHSSVDADKVLGLGEASKPKAKLAVTEPQFVTVNLVAEQGSFGGYELLQALLSNRLRFGQQQIFHRYTKANAQGEIVFSVASVAKPGTFDLQKMGAFETPGLVLFTILNNVSDPLVAFDSMLETAYILADDLGGKLLDMQRQPLTKQTISNLRKSVKHFIENRSIQAGHPEFISGSD